MDEDVPEAEGMEVIHDDSKLVDHSRLPPEDVFSALQSEVRLAVLRVLWAASEPPVPYSELERRVSIGSANFSYHVEQLVGHFVRRTEDGYELRHSGARVVQAVMAGGFTDDVSLGPLAVDAGCPYCGSTVEIRYADGLFSARCTGCPGVDRDRGLPRGTIMRYAFPPAGVFGRTPEDLLAAAHALSGANATLLINGVCPECAATVDHSLAVCEEHRPAGDGVCDVCGGRFVGWTVHECEHCGYSRQFAPWFRLLSDPAVVTSCHEQTACDRKTPFGTLTEWPSPSIGSITQSVVSTDPVRIRIEIPLESAELRATMDENLELVDVERSRRGGG
jgi:hypothetical protein